MASSFVMPPPHGRRYIVKFYDDSKRNIDTEINKARPVEDVIDKYILSDSQGKDFSMILCGSELVRVLPKSFFPESLRETFSEDKRREMAKMHRPFWAFDTIHRKSSTFPSDEELLTTKTTEEVGRLTLLPLFFAFGSTNIDKSYYLPILKIIKLFVTRNRVYPPPWDTEHLYGINKEHLEKFTEDFKGYPIELQEILLKVAPEESRLGQMIRLALSD